MTKFKSASEDQVRKLDYLVDSYAQMMQLVVEINKERNIQSDKDLSESTVFLREAYEVSKISLGIFIPLLASTFIYPVDGSVWTARLSLVVAIFGFIAIIIVYIWLLSKLADNNAKSREHQSQLMSSMLLNAGRLADIRLADIKKLGHLDLDDKP